jgi:hypothetical protein
MRIFESNYLTCPGCFSEKQNKCHPFFKTNLIASVLDIILDDMFKKAINESISSNSNDYSIFKSFKKNIEDRIKLLENEIFNKRNEKFNSIKDYLTKENEICANAICELHSNTCDLLREISAYRQELSYVQTSNLH